MRVAVKFTDVPARELSNILPVSIFIWLFLHKIQVPIPFDS